MKRTSRLISTLALMLMALGAAPSADAALKARSTTLDPATGGAPTWYQDQLGVTVAPCIDNLGACGLVADQGFNGTLPEVFPLNINEEWFYWSATAGPFPVGSSTALALQALEVTYLQPITNLIVLPSSPGAQAVGFQRLRVKMLSAPLAGTYTILHPFGQTTFDCPTAGIVCSFTRDLGGAVAGEFDAALGVGVADSVSNFLVQSPPSAGFPGYLGDGATVGPVTGGTVRQNYDIIGPAGVSVGSSAAIAVTGKKFGMDVAPNPVDFAAVVIPGSSLAQTVTVSNVNTVNTLVITAAPGGLILTGANPADFVITADTCSGATLAIAATPADPASSCTFTVTFTPLPITPTELAVRTAAVNVNATTPVGTPPGLALLSGTAQYPATITTAANGAVTPTGAVNVNAGSAQVYTFTPSPKYQVKDILVDGVVKPFTKPANPTQSVQFTAPAIAALQTINATFMPSGDLNADGKLDAGDALKALKIVVGLQTPDATDPAAMDVAPLGPDARPAGDNVQDLKDILLILRRAVGVVTW